MPTVPETRLKKPRNSGISDEGYVLRRQRSRVRITPGAPLPPLYSFGSVTKNGKVHLNLSRQKSGRFGACDTASALTDTERMRFDMAEISPITIARFWSKVSVTKGNSECWTWNGAYNGNGYGNFRIPEFGRQTYSAHRVAYLLANGSFPPDGLLIRHKCDNPRCVNPNHLEPGTVKDNAHDMVERGRHPGIPSQTGENNRCAKLSRADVDRVREMIEAGLNNQQIAKEFGVHHATISCIRTGKTWAA